MGQRLFQNLFGYEWELSKSPAGAHQWVAKNAQPTIPHAFDASRKLLPTMLTTDLSLRFDPAYEKISRRFMDHPEELAEAFARAWFKLTHRDMGPRALPGSGSAGRGTDLAGSHSQGQPPAGRRPGRGGAQAEGAGQRPVGVELVSTAWASASTFRGSDKRGGANGARIRLAPQKDWAVNQPAQLAKVLKALEAIQADFNRAQSGGKKISLADLIVLAGCAGVEQAAKKAGVDVTVPFAPGRMDATQEQTDVDSFAPLEPVADGFRNYLKTRFAVPAEALLIDRAQLLTLTAPEMTVLIGGLRVLEVRVGQDRHGVFTDRPGALSNDFFRNLLDMGTEWKPLSPEREAFEGRDRKTGQQMDGQPHRPAVRLHSQLRALAEVYASEDAQQKFVRDFVAAWVKVMNLDRYDLA